MVSIRAKNKFMAWVRLEAKTYDRLRGNERAQARVLGLLFDMKKGGSDFETTKTAVERVVGDELAIAAVEFQPTDIYELERVFRKVRNG